MSKKISLIMAISLILIIAGCQKKSIEPDNNTGNENNIECQDFYPPGGATFFEGIEPYNAEQLTTFCVQRGYETYGDGTLLNIPNQKYVKIECCRAVE